MMTHKSVHEKESRMWFHIAVPATLLIFPIAAEVGIIGVTLQHFIPTFV